MKKDFSLTVFVHLKYNEYGSTTVFSCLNVESHTSKTLINQAQCQEVFVFLIFFEKQTKKSTIKTKHSIMKTKHTPKMFNTNLVHRWGKKLK